MENVVVNRSDMKSSTNQKYLTIAVSVVSEQQSSASALVVRGRIEARNRQLHIFSAVRSHLILKNAIMSSFLLVIILISIFFGCGTISKKKLENNDESFIIKKGDTNRIRIDSVTGDTIEFMRVFYFDYNIILIDSVPDVYYHKDFFHCYTDYPLNNILPFYAFMDVDDFYKCASAKEMEDIILKDSSFSRDRLYIVSNKDTIRDKRYFLLKNTFLANNIQISTRVLTEEESYIMKAILTRKEYCPENIQWKKTLEVPDKATLIELKNEEP